MPKSSVNSDLEFRDENYYIPLSDLRRGEMNVFRVNTITSVIVFYEKENIRIVHDACPHMGGPLAQGKICRKSKALVCPWHGYSYSIDTLCLESNPNESIWIEPLAGEQASAFKTPQYKMREIAFKQIDGQLVISASSL